MSVDVANAVLAEKDARRLLSDVVDDARALAKHGGDRRGQVSNINLTKGGTNAAYLAARLKRDAPEIAARVDEFPSMRAAAIAAGIIRERTEAGLRRTIVETQRTFGGDGTRPNPGRLSRWT